MVEASEVRRSFSAVFGLFGLIVAGMRKESGGVMVASARSTNCASIWWVISAQRPAAGRRHRKRYKAAVHRAAPLAHGCDAFYVGRQS